jgi:hypothetical protein
MKDSQLMKTNAYVLPLAVLGATLVAASAQTTQQAVTTTPVPPMPALSSTEQTIKDIKNPTSWLSWGADLRIRDEYFNNLLTLNQGAAMHEQDYMRFRGRLWVSVLPVENVSLNARIVDETREWWEKAGYTPYRYDPNPPWTPKQTGRRGYDWREGIIDSLNAQWRDVGGMPVTVTAGRQDLFMGDGWLMGDGTPIDGSWTYYLDSVRVTWDLKEKHTVIDAIGIIQDAHDDGWMPTINPNHLLVTEQNEKGVYLQVANSSIEGVTLTPYFAYKHDSRVASNGDNAEIYTIGGRVNGLVQEHWKYWVEGAYQCGRKADSTIKYPVATAGSSNYRGLNAYGFNSKLSYLFKDQYNSQLACSFEMLSGDNPNTGTDEMFDVLWGRWPRWSEIGLYSYAAETRVGQEANLIRVGPSYNVTPMKDLDFTTSYYALWGISDIPTREASATLFSNNGNFRGHFLSAVLKYKFSAHMNGHLWSEFLFPNDYYANHQLISFLRAEVMFTF